VATLGLCTVPHPLDLREIPLNLVWHQRYETDPAHTWLRDVVRSTLTAIRAGDRRR
jgi:hypothetical protein